MSASNSGATEGGADSFTQKEENVLYLLVIHQVMTVRLSVQETIRRIMGGGGAWTSDVRHGLKGLDIDVGFNEGSRLRVKDLRPGHSRGLGSVGQVLGLGWAGAETCFVATLRQ